MVCDYSQFPVLNAEWEHAYRVIAIIGGPDRSNVIEITVGESHALFVMQRALARPGPVHSAIISEASAPGSNVAPSCVSYQQRQSRALREKYQSSHSMCWTQHSAGWLSLLQQLHKGQSKCIHLLGSAEGHLAGTEKRGLVRWALLGSKMWMMVPKWSSMSILPSTVKEKV